MGKKDEYYYDYLDDNDRFADQINGALFQGKQVVKPDELKPADAQMVYLGKEAGARGNVKVIADKARMWRGSMIHILLAEHQSHVDYRMVVRNLLSESLNYHKQWKQKSAYHDRVKDLRAGTDAYFSGMKKDEKFIPVITLVVYCGTEHPWDGAKCLHDLLDIDEEMKEFVSNYRLNLYDCQEHNTFEEYHTGLRQLFETVRYSKDKVQLKRVINENKEIYNNIDRDTREVLAVLANVRIPEECKVMKDGEERFEMCKAFEDYRLEGKEEGKAEGKVEGKAEGMLERLVVQVCKKLQKNKAAEEIAEELEEELSEIGRIVAAQKKAGNYDVRTICEELVK